MASTEKTDAYKLVLYLGCPQELWSDYLGVPDRSWLLIDEALKKYGDRLRQPGVPLRDLLFGQSPYDAGSALISVLGPAHLQVEGGIPGRVGLTRPQYVVLIANRFRSGRQTLLTPKEYGDATGSPVRARNAAIQALARLRDILHDFCPAVQANDAPAISDTARLDRIMSSVEIRLQTKTQLVECDVITSITSNPNLESTIGHDSTDAPPDSKEVARIASEMARITQAASESSAAAARTAVAIEQVRDGLIEDTSESKRNRRLIMGTVLVVILFLLISGYYFMHSFGPGQIRPPTGTSARYALRIFATDVTTRDSFSIKVFDEHDVIIAEPRLDSIVESHHEIEGRAHFDCSGIAACKILVCHMTSEESHMTITYVDAMTDTEGINPTVFTPDTSDTTHLARFNGVLLRSNPRAVPRPKDD